MIAGFILASVFEKLELADRKALRDQLAQLDFEAFKEALRAHMEMPTHLMPGTSLVALAFIMAEIMLNKREITEDQFKVFTSEITGGLNGKSYEQRSSERTRNFLDTLGRPPLRAGEDDTSEVQPSIGWSAELPELNGHECKARLVLTATGYAIVRQDDGAEITERRSLTQQDLEKVKSEDWGHCRYANLHTRNGKIVSCLIVGQENEVVGSPRAFWWSLAKGAVRVTDVRASGVRMSVHALAHVHRAARGMWDAVIEHSRSIEELREEPMYARNNHFEVISKLIENTENEAEKLGLEICKAMVLAVQSEDDNLEGAAYRCFRRYLWQPGEEPQEFYHHDAAQAAC